MRNVLFSIVVCSVVIMASPGFAAELKAFTEDNPEVALSSDGRWRYADHPGLR